MSRTRTVREYIKELEVGKDERPDQVKQGLELFIDLWKKAIERGVVSEDDRVEDALHKIEELGGLYRVAED